MLTVSMFGPMRIALDGTPLTLAASPKVGALLAYVLLHRPHRIPRPNIAFALWPDSIESGARASLRRHLYMLAQALPATSGEPWLSIDTRTVAWNANAPLSVDVERFEKASLDEARLHEAVEAYAGDLLEGFEDEWIVAERERFRQRHGENLGRLVKRASSRGEIVAAIGYAQAALRLDPYSEDAARAVMRLCHAAGNRSSALVEFERFAGRLRDELGVEPMPETTELYESIVTNVPVGQAAPATSTPDDTATQPALPFVGRDGALHTLNEAWNRAKQGRGSVVLVGGEAGVGKTRLTQQFVTAAKIDAGAVLRGETAFIETTPYQAVIEALHGAASDPDLANVEPVWPEALDARGGAPLDALAERRRLFESFATGLEKLAAVRPLLLVLEDVHWAGDATLALLEYVARRVTRERIVVVATFREEEAIRSHPLRELQRRLRAQRLLTKITLGPLSHDEVATLVASAGDLPTNKRNAADYFQASEGHPLFVTELLRGGLAGLEVLPTSLDGAIRQRFSGLSEPARTVVELAAVVGRGFDVELLRELSGWGEREVLDQLDELIARQIVRETAGSNAGYGYNFRHHLFQTFAYDQIREPTRMHRHLRVARSIEALYPNRTKELAPELAHHYARAQRPDTACAFYAVAARSALDVYASEDAISYVACAYALVPSAETELELLLLREEAYRRLGKRDEQRADVKRILRLAEHSGNAETLSEALERHIEVAHAAGDRADESRTIDRLAACAREASLPRAATALKLRGRFYLATGRYLEAREALMAAIAAFDAIDEIAGSVEAQLAMVTLYRVNGEIDNARELLIALERKLDGKDDLRFLTAQVLIQRAQLVSHLKRHDEMPRLGSALLRLSRQIGYVEGQARAFGFLGTAASWTFDIVAARSYLGEASRLFEALGNRNDQFMVTIELSILAVRLGRLDEALVSFEKARTLAQEIGNIYGSLSALVNISYAQTLSKRYDAALEAAETAIAGSRRLNASRLLVPALINLGVAARELGDDRTATSVLTEAVEVARQQGLEGDRIEGLAHLAFAFALAGNRVSSEAALGQLSLFSREAADVELLPAYALVSAGLANHCNGNAVAGREIFARAYILFRKRLEAIKGKEARAAFRSLPDSVAIICAAEKGVEHVVFGRFADGVPVS